MKNAILLLFLILVTIAGSSIAHAADWNSGVLIVVYNTQYGTGWWVNRFTVVTAAHVVGWTSNVNVTLVKGSYTGEGSVIYVDTVHDIAVITVRDPPDDIHIFPIAKHVEQHQQLYVIGYPFELVQLSRGNLAEVSKQPRVAEGYAAWYDPKYKLIEFQAETDAGNSGGPVVYANGAVAGLVSFALQGKVGVLYFASDADSIRSALDKAGVSYTVIEPPPSGSMNAQLTGNGTSLPDRELILWTIALSLLISITVTAIILKNKG